MHPSLNTYFLQPRIIIAASLAVAALAAGAVYFYTIPRTAGSYVHPTQGPITEEVDTTGTVKAADSVDLSFEKSGRISYVAGKVGSHVSEGTTLASINAADLQAAVEQAHAALQVQQAKLDSLKAGPRREDIAVSQAGVGGAESSVAQGKQAVLSAARNAYVVSDDAIRNKVDQFFENPRTLSRALTFTLNDVQLQSSVTGGRLTIEDELTGWQAYVSSLPVSGDDVDAAAAARATGRHLLQVGEYLNQVATALTRVVYTTTVTPAVIQGYQMSITTARGNIAAAVSALNAAETSEQSAESALASARSGLVRTQAPATAEDLAEQVAQVASAQAGVDVAQAELGKAAIRAPFSGTITVNNAHLGQTASPGAPLISMISDARFRIEAYVSEADVAKVKAGNSADVTLDAYKNEAPLAARVISVDPAATLQNGVSSYKVTLQFENDSRAQAGLTGNVGIITQTKQNVLQVPSSAIVRQESGAFVLRASSSGDELVPVETGIVSTEGMTEITGGISAGDSIRSFGVRQ